MIIVKFAKKFYQLVESLAQKAFNFYMDSKVTLFNKLDAKADAELIRHEEKQKEEVERHANFLRMEDERHFTAVADIGKKQAELAEL